MTSWGVPNWKDCAAYETKEWNEKRWRWEFLRRWDDVRKEWQELIDKHFEQWGEPSSKWPHSRLEANNAPFLTGSKIFQSWLPNPSMSHEQDPSIYEVDLIDWPLFDVPAPPTPNSDHFYTGKHTMRVDFNLALPLEPQIKAAKEKLRQRQKESQGRVLTRRLRLEKWTIYLRVLDARYQGASWSEITKALFPTDDGNQTARNHLTQAEDLLNKIQILSTIYREPNLPDLSL